jgi:hypothetical protein
LIAGGLYDNFMTAPSGPKTNLGKLARHDKKARRSDKEKFGVGSMTLIEQSKQPEDG